MTIKDAYHINESRFEDWKGNKDLTFIDRKIGEPLVKYKKEYYNFEQITEALGVMPDDIKYASDKDIIRAIKTLSKQKIPVNEARYDFNHLDPLTGLPREIKRPAADIELMSRMPARSCWITLLQNRVNMNSVGNNRFKKTLWFDRKDCTLSTDKNKKDAVHFRSYVLPGAGKPAGWIYADVN